MAYGHVPRPAGSNAASLRARLYPLPERARDDERAAVLCIPFNADGVPAQEEYERDGAQVTLQPPQGLMETLGEIFNAELERGLTYPQYGPMTLAEFHSYYLGYDLIVAFFLSPLSLPSNLTIPSTGLASSLSVLPHPLTSLDYKKHLAGFYYIKPNYPGRSSHICNAGFIVPSTSRGFGLGGVLGQSFLHYAPIAGYKSSVFNLVYQNNLASVKIWQRLGFQIVGKIPKAGRLNKNDGNGEEFVDAFVIYNEFDPQDDKVSQAEAEV